MIDAGDLLTIDELIARAEFEPELVDVYVEGPADVAILKMLFEHLGLEAGVFTVDDRLQVLRSEVEPLFPDYGNRAKLIAAAAVVHRALGSGQTNLTFVVDADWAYAVGPMPLPVACLFMTEKPSLEHYFLEDAPFSRFLALGVLRPHLDPATVKLQLMGAMLDIAVARVVLEGVNVACLDGLTSVCQFDCTPSTADTREIIRRSLDKIPRPDQPATLQHLLDQCDGYRQMLDEAGHTGRGHDIAKLLVGILGLKGHYADVNVVEALMRTSMTPADMLEHAHFRSIADRVAAAGLEAPLA